MQIVLCRGWQAGASTPSTILIYSISTIAIILTNYLLLTSVALYLVVRSNRVIMTAAKVLIPMSDYGHDPTGIDRFRNALNAAY